MMFLFDDEEGQSHLRDCLGWDDAELLAEEEGLELIGEFLHYVDFETDEIIRVQ